MVPVRCSLSMPVLRQNGSETLERVEKKKKRIAPLFSLQLARCVKLCNLKQEAQRYCQSRI